MMEEIRNLLLYNNIYETLEVYKKGESYCVVSTIDFNLQYNFMVDDIEKLTYKEMLLIYVASELKYDEIDNIKEKYKLSIDKYKEIAINSVNEKLKHLSLSNENYNRKIYAKLDDEDKEMLKEYFELFYGSLEEGIKNDYYLMQKLRAIYDYLETAKVLLGNNLLKKISNPKLFALGIYSKEDYNIMLEFNENINKKYNFTEKFDFNTENLYQKFKIRSIHDMGFDIIVKNDRVELFSEYYTKLTFTNATMLNYDKLKKCFDTCKEGYVEYLFKYKDGKYLAIYDFLELPEPVVIKFDDLIVGYTDEDINK